MPAGSERVNALLTKGKAIVQHVGFTGKAVPISKILSRGREGWKAMGRIKIG